MVGFVDLGEVNNHLLMFEQAVRGKEDYNSPDVANSILVFMVKKLFHPFRFVYAQFPCASIAGELLFNPFWESVFRLENIGFKVLSESVGKALCWTGGPEWLEEVFLPYLDEWEESVAARKGFSAVKLSWDIVYKDVREPTEELLTYFREPSNV
uniref:Uncharacterized protein n=1 Tax=Amphimedon queenslandica TaxID=400682 RepID=A0A1X7UP11_AMPQE